jgi:methionine-rich copper-binding protein CopC
MLRIWRRGGGFAAIVVALGLVTVSAGNVFAHARYDYSLPADGSTVDGQPFVLRTYFTQELTSKSTLRVIDANGVQVDYADGRVDLDDPDRKLMLVTLPELPAGTYTVEFVAESAEDGHAEPGTFGFNVGEVTPGAGESTEEPGGAATPLPNEGGVDLVVDAY